MNKTTADTILDELGDFSKRAVEILLGPGKTQTDKTSGSWSKGNPKGITLHYTASTGVESTLQYFIRNPAKVSSWAFVLDGIHPKLADLQDEYSLLSKHFKSTVIEFGSPNKVTWHGGWVNKIHLGIDLRNLGYLNKLGDGSFVDGYGRPYKGRAPVKAGDYWWEPYSRQQIESTLNLCKAAVKHFKLQDPERLLPHSCSKWTKRDVGLAFPMEAVRGATYKLMFGDRISYLDGAHWTSQCLIDQPQEYEIFDFEEDSEILDSYYQDEIDDYLADPEEEIEETGYKFDGKIDTLSEYRDGLKLLQYHVDRFETLTDSLKLSTWYFQKAHKLRVDSVPGPKTYAAMEKALKAWGLK